MAYRVKESELTQSQRINVSQSLLLVKERTKFQKRKKIQAGLVKAYAKDGEYVMLPKAWAQKVLDAKVLVKPVRTVDVAPFNVSIELREHQREIVNIALDSYKKRNAVFLNVFCSFGKTLTALYLASQVSKDNKGYTLIIYPRKMVNDAWIQSVTNSTDARLYVIGELIVSPETLPQGTQIILCMSKRVLKMTRELRRQISHVIIDEADMFCTQGHIPQLLALEPSVITLMSATYERDDGMQKILDLIVGTECRITRISSKEFSVIKLATGCRYYQRTKNLDWDDFTTHFDNLEERNLLIAKIVRDNRERKTCVFTSHKDHARTLFTIISEYMKEVQGTVSLLYDDDKDYVDADVLVTTRSKSGVGFDPKYVAKNWDGRHFDLEIITCSANKVEQVAGRVGRTEDPIIIDLVDEHPVCDAQWDKRCRWYQSRNGNIFNINRDFALIQDFDVLKVVSGQLEIKREESIAELHLRLYKERVLSQK